MKAFYDLVPDGDPNAWTMKQIEESIAKISLMHDLMLDLQVLRRNGLRVTAKTAADRIHRWRLENEKPIPEPEEEYA